MARREFAEHAPPLLRLAHVPRRCGEVHEAARARLDQLAHGVRGIPDLVYPDVLAHGEPERLAALAQAHRLAARGGLEPALLVEDVVGGKQRLRAHRAALAAGEQHGGVHQALRALALRGQHGAERDRDALRGGCERVELAQLVAHEALALEQIHRRIAGEDHLRQDHEVRALARRLGGGLLDESPVAAEVADGGVHLGQRDAHPTQHRGVARSRQGERRVFRTSRARRVPGLRSPAARCARARAR